MLSRWLLAVGVILLTFTAFLLLGQETPSYQDCKGQYEAQYAANTKQDHQYVVGLLAKCEGVAIDANNGTITAIATVLLTVVTGFLAYLAWDQGRSAKVQSRAYLSVIVGGGYYQERQRPMPLRFQSNPVLVNTGNTPAYKVSYIAMAKVMTDKAAIKFPFEIPNTAPISQASVGPKDSRIMNALVFRFVPDKIVGHVIAGNRVAMWVWGKVSYEDVYGQEHFTEFCQRINWRPDGSVYGQYAPRLGKST